MKEEELKYKCEVENCQKEVGQIIWSPEDKKWKCVKCYYKKDVPNNPKN